MVVKRPQRSSPIDVIVTEHRRREPHEPRNPRRDGLDPPVLEFSTKNDALGDPINESTSAR